MLVVESETHNICCIGTRVYWYTSILFFKREEFKFSQIYSSNQELCF